MIRITLTALCMLIGSFINVNAHHHDHDIDIDIFVDNGGNEASTSDCTTCITGGLSDSEVAELLTVGVAAGSHQFDFSTQDWQGSVTGSWYDDENAVSFGLAKRWDRFGQVLLHGNLTQNGSENLYVFGGTFRF